MFYFIFLLLQMSKFGERLILVAFSFITIVCLSMSSWWVEIIWIIFMFALFPASDIYQILHEWMENGQLQIEVPDTSFKISHHISRRLNEFPLIFLSLSIILSVVFKTWKEIKHLAFFISSEFFVFNLHWQMLSVVVAVLISYCLKWCSCDIRITSWSVAFLLVLEWMVGYILAYVTQIPMSLHEGQCISNMHRTFVRHWFNSI